MLAVLLLKVDFFTGRQHYKQKRKEKKERQEQRRKEKEAGKTKESDNNENEDTGIANMYESAKDATPKASAMRKDSSGKKSTKKRVSGVSFVTKTETITNVPSASQIEEDDEEDDEIEERPESSAAKNKILKQQDSASSGVSEQDSAPVTVVSPPMSAAAKRKQQQNRRPLPGQSQYKVPGYKQTSRACEIS